ncbi:MAG: ion transporter [Bacteroidota bacterium]
MTSPSLAPRSAEPAHDHHGPDFESDDVAPPPGRAPWRDKIHEVIFGTHTPAGKAFDIVLIGLIALSLVAVMLESVETIRMWFHLELRAVEWFFTVVFTIEYVLRLASAYEPKRYARSFYGVIDLLAILPTYISAFVPGAQFFLIVRILRFLRVFRILKLVNYLSEADELGRALVASRRKIFVFIFVVLTLVTILGSLMYIVEGGQNGFTSIPRSMYWAVVTLTTVGYGDIAPQTTLGQFITTFIVILGYGIIAVPTGIVTTELSNVVQDRRRTAFCPACGCTDHDADAAFCKRCGTGVRTAGGVVLDGHGHVPARDGGIVDAPSIIPPSGTAPALADQAPSGP